MIPLHTALTNRIPPPMAVSAISLSSFLYLSICTPHFSLLTPPPPPPPYSAQPPPKRWHSSLSITKPTSSTTNTKVKSSNVETTFFDNLNPINDVVFDPPAPPKGFVPPPSFNKDPLKAKDEIVAAYEELYGLGYSGVSVLSNEIYVMDSKVKKATRFGSKVKKEKMKDRFEEGVVQVRRVRKVVKGGKQY